MMLQGVDSNMGNLSAVPFGGDDANCAKNQMYGEVSKEAKTGANMNVGSSTSVHVAGDDRVFANNVSPARIPVHGTFMSLSLSLLFYLILLYIGSCEII